MCLPLLESGRFGILEDSCRILLSKACGDAARHLHKFFGSSTAEIIACEVFVEVRQQKLRLEISAAKLLNQKAV